MNLVLFYFNLQSLNELLKRMSKRFTRVHQSIKSIGIKVWDGSNQKDSVLYFKGVF